MSRGKKDETESVKYQGRKKLNQMFEQGYHTSKFKDKQKNRSASEDGKFHYQDSACKDKIYSIKTLKVYTDGWNRYCKNMKEDHFKVNGHSPKTLEEAALYMPDYLNKLNKEGKSAWSVGIYFSSVAKVLGLSRTDYDLPRRSYIDIKRSREDTATDAHVSAVTNAELIQFCRCSGCRKSELRAFVGTQLHQWDDGTYYLEITGKGGRKRRATIIGSEEEIQAVVTKCMSAGADLIWNRVPRNLDVHALRREYAKKYYAQIMNPDLEHLSRKQKYICADGVVFDRKAALTVSYNLGHSRVNVSVNHYLK